MSDIGTVVICLGPQSVKRASLRFSIIKPSWVLEAQKVCAKGITMGRKSNTFVVYMTTHDQKGGRKHGVGELC